MNIRLLLTGNELMTGDIIDSNSAMIAQQLLEVGLSISIKTTIGDSLQNLVEQLNSLSQGADILLVNGGLGPTQDDLTALALAQLTSNPLQEHPEALKHLKGWCEQRGSRLNQANLKQALLPKGADIIANSCGSAVGIALVHNGCRILCTPGVPSELKAMLQQSIIPELQSFSSPQDALLLRRFHTFGLGESGLQQWITDQLPDWPDTIELGFRAGAPTLEVKLQTRHRHAQQHHQWGEKLHRLISEYIVAEGQDSLQQSLVTLLKQQRRTMTTAESCTGGLIASMLTQIPGSSQVFESGFVTYSNEAKARMLGVSERDLTEHGAVSEPVVRQMASGALERSGADYTVAVSGIAGPDGGSSEKPVGLVWIAWGSVEQLHSACLYFPYQRKTFQTMVAGAALDLVRRLATGITSQPRYLRDRRPPKP